MHRTFTGSSRPTRQVNLSGRRNVNPFNNPFEASSGTSAALANAHQEREKRQRERDRISATKLIQRNWRGYRCRRDFAAQWRATWDTLQFNISSNVPFSHPDEAYQLAQPLLRFASLRDKSDLNRLRYYFGRLAASSFHRDSHAPPGPWSMTYLRFQGLLLAHLQYNINGSIDTSTAQFLVDALILVVSRIPTLSAKNSKSLYQTMSRLLLLVASADRPMVVRVESLAQCLLAPMTGIASEILVAYESFIVDILTLSVLSKPPLAPTLLLMLAEGLNYKILATQLRSLLDMDNTQKCPQMTNPTNLAYLLGHLIYFYRHAHRLTDASFYTDDRDYLDDVSSLLTLVASGKSVKKRRRSHQDDEAHDGYPYLLPEPVQNNQFIQEQVMSLVEGENIIRLLGSGQAMSTLTEHGGHGQHAKQLASFALTLLRFFPRRGDDIRIQLYKGSTASNSRGDRLPAIRYFWNAAKSTTIFQTIISDIDNAVPFLKEHNSGGSFDSIKDDWRIILVFFELYSFVLRLMDDTEFFSASTPHANGRQTTWASQNALPLDEVKDLTTFLKHVGFSMYYKSKELSLSVEGEPRTMSDITKHFTVFSKDHEKPQNMIKPIEPTFAGIAGISLDYAKGLVTGLLRLLYERDSRTPFLPKGHWLMTSHLDMYGFTESVFSEEEARRKFEEADDSSGTSEADEESDQANDRDNVIGAGHSARVRRHERLRRRNKYNSKLRMIRSLAPRLEILENTPFFIPFETRVSIFRDFVSRDQEIRRGTRDPDMWRFTAMTNPDLLRRHQARIRRRRCFKDAFEAFHPLGDSLKEPIQITFIDAFDQQEAGIDGGGVTKEFLTTITKEAFHEEMPMHKFVENDQHLLYPNPTYLEEISELERLGWLPIEEPEVNVHDDSLPSNSVPLSGRARALAEYEFLGRVIGKCLYEGILVDVNFASFFLLKWALTGGEGSAPKESGYRATLNDLRNLDNGLYQGLLQLKNHSGDVADFGLDFTIVDTVRVKSPNGQTSVKNIVRELKPGGANIPVTNENRLVYISYVARHRLQIQPGKQTTAFLHGLSSMIRPSWLNMFNQQEIQTLLSGTNSSIDVEDLRKHTQYGGVYVIGTDGQEHPTIKLFWEVMRDMSDSERRAVLKFVTSTPRAPLLGFGSLSPKFSIRDSGGDATRLPSTSTCVNLMKLPIYKSKATLREKLLMAVMSGAGFDLS